MQRALIEYYEAARSKMVQWYAMARESENFELYAFSGVLIFVSLVVFCILAKRGRDRRNKPGRKLRENMEKMRKDAPYKGNRR